MAKAGTHVNNGTGECENAARHYFVYMVRCSDGSLYTGYSTDVEHRVAQHNAGAGAKYTRARRPVTLVAQAGFDTQHEALSAEWRIKRLDRQQKLRLVRAYGHDPVLFRAQVSELIAPSGEKPAGSDL